MIFDLIFSFFNVSDMAGSFARSVNTKHLVLTHYSQRYKMADATLKAR